ncbi:MAG: 30S ribosomal protein S17 [bacterium]|nr:30S ribosomal protein S17 [bacterium]
MSELNKPVEQKALANKKIIRKFSGVVVSDKMNKTIVVKVDLIKTHPKYLKSYTMSQRYKVHDEKEMFKEGDKVSFVECRPMSKEKRWRVLYSREKSE